MDDIVLRGMAKWPNVPAVYGWLSLDRRGHWLLKGERVVNPAIASFFGRNYSHDDRGRWFFQNGPQRVFVTLDYTPHIYRIVPGGDRQFAAVSHSGADAGKIHAAYIDETGQLLLDTELGIGLLHDRDLETVLPYFSVTSGKSTDAALDAALENLQTGSDAGLRLNACEVQIAVLPIRATEVPERFGFIARPRQPAGQEECY